jgi:molybdopterin adenylyltransferase
MSAGFRAAVLTVSDTASSGGREDLSGRAAVEFVNELRGEVVVHDVVPDERPAISERLRHYADKLGVALVLTTGGTGLALRDVTPEATRDVIEREAPGLAEAMRRETAALTPLAILSRSVAGLRGATLIINLPGSARAVRQCLDVLKPSLRHGLQVLSGDIRSHDEPEK